MTLYIRQRAFSWRDSFSVYDADGNELYFVEGELFTWGKRLHVYDTSGNELAFVQQKLFSFFPRYYIYRSGVETAEVVKEPAFLRQQYAVNGLGWTVCGDFWAHEYEIFDDVGSLAQISKAWFTLGDAYELRIADGFDAIAALAVVLVVDACIAAEN